MSTDPSVIGVVDPACAAARGDLERPVQTRTLVAVFASPVAAELLHLARHVRFRTVLLEPDLDLVSPDRGRAAVQTADAVVADIAAAGLGPDTDVVVTDHDRPDLGPVLAAVLGQQARWIGVVGSPRHAAPHVPALRALGVSEGEIARVHRPIGLNIGARTPGEIAVATLAGLLADHNDRPGGFAFG